MKKITVALLVSAVTQFANAELAITQVLPFQKDDGTELRIVFNGIPVLPKSYQLDNPSRLLLDFDGIENKVVNDNVIVNTTEASNVTFQKNQKLSRLVVGLKDFGEFTTRTEGNTLILKINANQPGFKGSTIDQIKPANQASRLEDITFSARGGEEGLVKLNLSGRTMPVDVKQQGNKIIVRLVGVKVPTHLIRRLNVNDFSTPVQQVEAFNEGNTGVVVIQAANDFDYVTYHADEQFTISVKPQQLKNTALTTSSQNYSGKKISLDFQDIEVRRVLQLLAEFTEMNIVAADSVQGNITIRLKDVPWDQALDIILKTKKLSKRHNGNVIWVAPVAELLKAEEDEAKAIDQNLILAPLKTEYIQLKYVKVSDVVKMLKDTKDTTNAMLGPRGSVVSDVRTNTLVLRDTASKINELTGMLSLLDVPMQQVVVEARVVRASDSFSKELGVKWGISGNSDEFYVSGDRESLQDLTDEDSTQYADLEDNINVDLGVTDAAGQITFGLLDFSNFMLDLELSASQAEGLTEVISTPKVMTADKQKAVIKSGVEIPYQTTSTSGSTTATSTEFKDAVLMLEVTPSITPDGKVQMQLNITKDAQNGYAENGEALISTNEIVTNVLVGNGETVVLGGVFEDVTEHSVTKIPFFGDLPFIGRFFRNTSNSKSKEELLIFVTPRIVNDISDTNR